MASKSASNRRKSPPGKSPAAVDYGMDDQSMEESQAYQHGFLPEEGDDESTGYLQQASERVRELTYEREGRVVVGALAAGFVIGAAIGCAIATTRKQNESWSDRLAYEGLGRRLLERIGSSLPESISERFGR